MKEIDICLEGVHHLGDILAPKLSECSNNEKQAVRLFASLMLCVLHRLKWTCQEETEEAAMRIKECRLKLQGFVKAWVVKYGVIGGSVFGAHTVSLGSLPSQTEKELKVIQSRYYFVLLHDVSIFSS